MHLKLKILLQVIKYKQIGDFQQTLSIILIFHLIGKPSEHNVLFIAVS